MPKTEADDPRRLLVARVRCAIYTRKSTDEGLDQDFNSLDAQREAAEAFILSQRGDGLVVLAERYDDGGFSGGNLERPALERLLIDIRGGAVDCVVVYKVDRLSRSLIDFARIIETLEKHNVSFVSVTQHFNTTNSLGRLTLNILLSFAQFEREIIAERTRDKISAARRKGKWTGGRPVLGYDIDPRGSRLTVNPDEALQVRTIFKLYLDWNALVPAVREINRRCWRTKQWVTQKGVINGGKPFTKGRLFRLLTNPIYIGKVDFKKQIYEGEHAAIVEAVTWERVQEILKRNGHDGGAEVRNSYGSLLKGLLRCACCDADMIRIYRIRDSRRCRYYTCTKAQQMGRDQAKFVSEPAIKAALARRICRIGSDQRLVACVVAKAEEQWQTAIADLTLERDVARRKLANLGGESVKPPGNDQNQTVMGPVADLRERIQQLEARLTEIQEELCRLQSQTLDRGDVQKAIEQFAPVWDSLLAREQARILRALIEKVFYNGKVNKATVTFRSAAIREMCQGTGEDGGLNPSHRPARTRKA